MKKILLYGTGKMAVYYSANHCFIDEEVVGYVETVKSRDDFMGKKVFGVDEIFVEYDEIRVVNAYLETILKLLEVGIEKNKIAICNEILYEKYIKYNKGVLDIKYYEADARKYECMCVSRPKYLVTAVMENDMDVFGNEYARGIRRENYIRNEDYCRYGVLKLIIEEIKRRGIKGSIAELGVFQGEFAKYLNASFTDRKILLFDTFEGFNDTDVKYEIGEKFTSQEWFSQMNYFRNTNVELVMSKMRYPENCIIRKGYFPETIPQEEYEYALVSLDCDLYLPILEGLKYFYPRLQEGGYIMVHDYNYKPNEYDSCLEGVRKAINDFEAEYGHVVKVPIPDKYGTIVISK